MTALDRYELLEAPGVYLDGETADSREVIVKFGAESLVFMALDETPLAHWPLATLRRLPEAPNHPGELRLIPDHGGLERLILTDRDMIAAIQEVCPDLHRPEKTPSHSKRRMVFWSIGAVASVLLVIFVLSPFIAARLAAAISPEAEMRLGDKVSEQIMDLLRFIGGDQVAVCETPEGTRAMEAMVARLGVQAHLPIRVSVINHGMVNALTAPGGRILVMRGLIDEASGPEEVAGVLAHEIGHVIHRDPTREVLRSAGTAGILSLALGDITGGGLITVVADSVLNASYTREAETAADDEALAMLAEAGLPSAPLADFFARMGDQIGDPEGVLSHLASHPEFGAREADARAADTINGAAFTPVISDQDWVALQEICGDRAPRKIRPRANVRPGDADG
jgi:Zn-dependent protease with chaperone function